MEYDNRDPRPVEGHGLPADKGLGVQLRSVEETQSIFDTIPKEKEFDLLVFIGRFQPFHNEHKRIIDIATEKAHRVLVLVGSAGSPRTIRNPWTYVERMNMIYGLFDQSKVFVKPIFDKTYNDNAWTKQIQDTVHGLALEFVNEGGFHNHGLKDYKIGLIGTAKDHTSYYLKMFPQWGNIDVPLNEDLHATDLRTEYFIPSRSDAKEFIKSKVPAGVFNNMYDSIGEYPLHPQYEKIQKEFLFVENYKKSWEAAPYPVKHLTVDSVVTQSGHVLLVKRRAEPGKGLWAIPGGHLEPNETFLNGAIRELKEETKIKVPEAVLRGSIVNQHTFDEVYRSNLGRVVTQAFHIDLPGQTKLPVIKGSDDAEKARWVPLTELREDMMFDDHFFIINFFLGL